MSRVFFVPFFLTTEEKPRESHLANPAHRLQAESHMGWRRSSFAGLPVWKLERTCSAAARQYRDR
jgi:hypothetical protein